MKLDSDKISSTFFTLCGLLEDLGLIVSTTLFSIVHEVESLKDCISGGIGSEDFNPQKVPEHGLPLIGLDVVGTK